jgi:endoglycosylceramidase
VGIAAVVALCSLAAGDAAAAHPGFVRAPGGPFMTDAQGRRLEFHGANLVAKCGGDTHASKVPGTPCLPGGHGRANYVVTPTARDPGRRFTARDARTLHRLGFSLVRLGVIWAALEPGPKGVGRDDSRYCGQHLPGTPYPKLGKADPYDQRKLDAYLHRVDRVVRLLARAHIRALIDMHQDGWGRPFAGADGSPPWMAEGAPAWATCTSGAPFGEPDHWQAAYTDPAVNGALEHFWQNDVRANLQGHFARVWKAVARHYANSRAVIGYDLFNEPSGPRALSPPEFDRQLQCFYAGSSHSPASCAASASQAPARGLVAAIQSVDRRHLVFYEAPVLTDFGSPETIGISEPLPFPRLGISFHVYGGVPGQTSFQCDQPNCGAQENGAMTNFTGARAATQTAQAGGPTWLVSEFGAEKYVPDVARVAKLADGAMVSWTFWSALQLHDPTGGPDEGLLDEKTRRPDRGRARVLARAYPLATAGTPTSQSFDPKTEAFDLTYTADPAVRAPTRIWIPRAYHYRHGYTVKATGARVTSRRGATVLTLRNAKGASAVTVRVRARHS